MATTAGLHAQLQAEPPWPVLDGRRPVFLLDASSELEARILDAWIERNRPPALTADAGEAIRLPPSRQIGRASCRERV